MWLSHTLFRVRRLGFFLVAVGGIIAALPSSAGAGSLVDRISFSERAEGHGYTVRFHTNSPIQTYSYPQIIAGGIIEIVLMNTGLTPGFAYETPHAPIQRVNAVPRDGNVVVRLKLDNVVPLSVTAYQDGESQDLLLDLTFVGRAIDREPRTAVPVRLISEERQAKRPGPSLGARERWKLDTVVIDAGHGGKDTGASAHGVQEKDVTLAVALKLGKYIEERLGCRVIYTRDYDYFVELRERGHIANRSGAKLFISLHANAASNQQADGTETYFLGMHKTEAARSVMDRENSVIEQESNPDQYKSFGESGLIIHALAQSAYMRKSEELAGLVEHALHTGAGRSSRGVKQAGFYVLWSASMPSILVELGFITNRNEAAFLSSERGQDYLASAIFRAVRDFKRQYEKDIDLVEAR